MFHPSNELRSCFVSLLVCNHSTKNIPLILCHCLINMYDGWLVGRVKMRGMHVGLARQLCLFNMMIFFLSKNHHVQLPKLLT